MTHDLLPFKYEEEKKDFGSTGLSGVLVFLDLLSKMGFCELVNRQVLAKKGKQGWSDYRVILSLMLLNICGGDCVSDIDKLESDSGLRRFFKNLELRNVFGCRRREKLKRQWRNGTRNCFPTSSSIFRYLLLFHNFEAEHERQKGKAFIPSSNEHLLSLSDLNGDMLEFLQLNNPVKVATIDMDATVVGSEKKQALYSYKKYKGYQPLNAWWWEQDYMVYTEFRDGNVPAGWNQKSVFEKTLSCLPDGVEKVYLRSDTAGYEHKLLKYCDQKENKRFGRIEFAIGCDVTPEFKKEVFRLNESDWHPIYRKVDGELKETGQEWAEVPFVPNAIGHSKKGPCYRYLGIREALKQSDGDSSESQAKLPFPTIQMDERKYKLFGLVTNINWNGETIIHWSRKRCGYSEHVHSEMKESFAGGQLPSGKFGCNAAWWWMMVLSLNLTSIIKKLVLPAEYKACRMKKIRYGIINIPGRVLINEKYLTIRLTRGDPGVELLAEIRKRITRLGAYAPG